MKILRRAGEWPRFMEVIILAEICLKGWLLMKITIGDILDITDGKLVGSFQDDTVTITALVDDSRDSRSHALFIPFKGEKNNGYDFIDNALDSGCAGCIIDRELSSYAEGKCYILVDNNLEAIWKIAKLWLSRLNGTKIICVTGSAGKTTTTRMLASVIRQRFSVFETIKNYNDEYSAPSMISLIEPDCEYAILELGMGLNSSVSKMATAIHPDALVLTNIGYAHIQRTGSLEGTRDEKCGAERSLIDNGRVYINGDDPLLREYSYLHGVTTYGTGLQNDIHSQEHLAFLPKHLMYSAIAAFAVGSYVGLSKEEIIEGIRAFSPATGRMDFIQCDRFLLIDSSFNANPASMKMAIDTLSGYEGKRIAVLGDMLELGSYSKQLHHELGAYVATSNIDTLIAVGKYAEDIKAGINNKAISITVCPNIEAGLNRTLTEIQKCHTSAKECTVLCKGSHGSEVYKIANDLKKFGGLYG